MRRLLAIALVLFATGPIVAQPPPPPNPADEITIGDYDIEKIWNPANLPNQVPMLTGELTFQGLQSTMYTIGLVASPSGHQTNPWTLVAWKNVNTNALGHGFVAKTELKGNLPLSTEGWYVRMIISRAEWPNDISLPQEWISVTD